MNNKNDFQELSTFYDRKKEKKVSLTTWVEFIHLAGRELIIIGHSGVCCCVLSCACDVSSASLVAFVAFTAVLQAAFCFS